MIPGSLSFSETAEGNVKRSDWVKRFFREGDAKRRQQFTQDQMIRNQPSKDLRRGRQRRAGCSRDRRSLGTRRARMNPELVRQS
jgi:hypothetical protein